MSPYLPVDRCTTSLQLIKVIVNAERELKPLNNSPAVRDDNVRNEFLKVNHAHAHININLYTEKCVYFLSYN